MRNCDSRFWGLLERSSGSLSGWHARSSNSHEATLWPGGSNSRHEITRSPWIWAGASGTASATISQTSAKFQPLMLVHPPGYSGAPPIGAAAVYGHGPPAPSAAVPQRGAARPLALQRGPDHRGVHAAAGRGRSVGRARPPGVGHRHPPRTLVLVPE